MEALLQRAATAGLTGSILVYAVALLGAAAHYRATAMTAVPRARLSWSGLVAHLFPPDLLRSRWSRMDVAIFVLNKSAIVLSAPAVATLVALIATWTDTVLIAAAAPPNLPQSPFWMLLFLTASLVLRDFGSFYLHVLQHRIPLLWEFHKVHHSPESLIPPTALRIHPFETIANTLSESLILGVLAGLAGWLANIDQADLIIDSVGLYAIVNILTVSPLRHSHIGLRLGPLEAVFLSPAHHHLHHSCEPHHWDKNFGAIFPIWDRIWRTLLPPPAEPYRLGLDNGQSEEYASVWRAYVTPLARLRRDGLARSLRPQPMFNRPAEPIVRLDR